MATKKPIAAKKPAAAKKPVAAKKPAAAKKTVAAKKPAAAKKPVTAKKISDSAIRDRAKEIYLKRMKDGSPGSSESDWHQAEQELKTNKK